MPSQPTHDGGVSRNGETGAAETFADQVKATFLAFIDFLLHVHSGQDKPASSLSLSDRRTAGLKATELWHALQLKMLKLIGARRTRSYAHHMMYSLLPIYMRFGKAWAVACEGNEALHKEMKLFYSRLVNHGIQGKNDMYQTLELHLANRQMLGEEGHRLPATLYAARVSNQVRRANRMRVVAASESGAAIGVNKKKRKRQSIAIVKGERSAKNYDRTNEKLRATKLSLTCGD